MTVYHLVRLADCQPIAEYPFKALAELHVIVEGTGNVVVVPVEVPETEEEPQWIG